MGSGDVGRRKKISVLDRPLPRLLYSLFVLIHPPFLLPPLSPSLSPVSPRSGVSALAFPLFCLDFFVREAPSSLSFLLDLARAPVSISGNVIRAFPLFILRARLFPRARVEAGLVAVLRVGSVRDLLWGVGRWSLRGFSG